MRKWFFQKLDLICLIKLYVWQLIGYLCFLLTLCFATRIVKSEYWCSPAPLAEKSYNRWISFVKKVIFLSNFVIYIEQLIKCLNLSDGIWNLLCNGKWGQKVIVTKCEKWGKRGSKKCQIECYVTVERSLVYETQDPKKIN